jgi:23S rRNA G2445 N2-methylase RlmL
VEEDADVELWVNLLRDELLCGVRLSGAEMRHRDYQVEHTPASLRPSVAAALVRLTKPNASDVFLDPVVGSGTILLERAAAGPYSRLIGGDNSADVLDVARANARGVRQLELREWDARALPLADASVDKAALNLPFGRQISPGANLRELYRTVFAELVRVIRPGGTVATLAGDASAVDSALRSNPTLRLIRRITVNLLGYDATISVLARSKGLGSRD